ncbi:protein phosphatase CheZ [Haematospirillum jordaniae]|nr:protein phosphatase CheZ [Haematospirillum jordaniae]NKD44530.1 protein phosphatase CheZ [Haematospirillum jordaniae]NKD57550.1 protein phosphatase CheZ [Haematospirillum jordaniae]NKD59472.1 protein phosphatase CheZ [Haematospirillum jordaniae]NKD67467.1 protein phosphatase CheZ [Haematospirillum jordaniae]NKD79699.1 protein phosphatase CheZ [Haematospirillum jordaniae]
MVGDPSSQEAPSSGQDSGLHRAVASRIADIREAHGVAVPVDNIGGVVADILDTLSGELSAEDMRLYQEVEQLAQYIRQARSEIAALNPTDIREEFLPTATDELDAIIQSTENATGSIMDATEAVEEVSGLVSEDLGSRLMDAATMIYEACSFQDLTGQRITKVVRMLKSIEERVESLVKAFDPKLLAAARDAAAAESVQQAGNRGRARAAAVGDNEGDDALLNGPQLDGDAMKQGDIDSLLHGTGPKRT